MGHRFSKAIRLLAVAWSIFALAGCGVIEPSDTTPNENQPPDTEITSGPRANANASYAVRIAWKGLDNDGVVVAYELKVDGGATVRTTRADSSFIFTAANKDEPHSISVAAVDNAGAVDPTPATLSFTATNVPPNTALTIEGSPAQGATFGRGAVFVIVPVDDPDNGADFSYRFKIDDSGQWSEWLNAGEIEFSTTSRFGLLPEGSHKFIAQVRDAAMAVDETPVEFNFNSSSTVKPAASLTQLINDQSFYEDNSAFSFPSGNTLVFNWSVAFNYAGARSAGSRYKVDGGAYTEFSTAASSVTLNNVTPGLHSFEVQYRDIGGALSDPVKFDYEIVEATKDQGVLVIDDGNGQLAGRPPATGDTNVDNFYTQTLTAVGARFTLYDILTQGNPTPKRGIGRYSTVIWASDEANFNVLPRTASVQLVTDYLNLGGKLWIAGWRGVNLVAGTTPVADFTPTAATPAVYNFIWNYLKIASTRQTPGNLFDFTGVTGSGGHPNMNVEASKNPIPNRNGLSPIDVFTVRSNAPGAQAIYTFNSFSSNPDFQGAVTGVKYIGTDFRVVVFGFPLYHMQAADAVEATRKVLQEFGEI